ncbi:MAG: hypothetical protein JNM51_04745, partial [Bacteroidia bacterium]|nr:hypothetical protein [Bacteroidia bacterium]
IYETEFDGKTISSGVASYEPMLGGDENPFRQPVFMGPNKWTMTTPDERFFMEEPFGETFFPSASIAYSKVKVKNKIPAGINNLKAHGTGYVIHEFYTAKDYPTITKHTSISPKQWKPALGGLLKVLARDYVSASQGYVIKLNDMHGKPKAQAVYPEGTTTPISKVEYFYKTKGGYVNYGLKDIYSDASCVANELDNTCVVIDQNGTIRTTTIGMDFDAVADFRQSETTTIMGGAQINLSMFLVGVFPGLVPTIWPDFSYEKTRFRSAVITKVISNYGILEKTTAHDLGSKVTTSNLAYDSQTGDVLVTKTKNNFEDDIYSVKYPAFWGYDLMGPAYKNIGLVETLSYSSPGTWTVQNSDFYNIGDELGINGNIGWVCSKSVNTISIIDKNGNLFAGTGSIKVKVLRSGKRNLLGAQMASLTSLVNPIDYDNNGLDPYLDIKTTSSPAVNYEVLNTSAIEYTDQWQTFKGYEISTPAGCECSITDRGIGAFNSLSNQISTNSLPSSITSNATNTQTFTVVFNGATCVFNGILNDTLDWKDIHFTNSTPPAYSVVQPGAECYANIVVCAPYTYSTAPTNTVASRGFFLNEGPGVVCFTITPANESCGPFVNCSTTEPFYQKCGVDVGDKVNPFVYGIKGNWRPKTTWSYLEERVQTPSSGNNNLDIRKDGRIKEYQPFYAKPASGTKWDRNTNYLNYWTFTSQITKHTPNGVEVENQDALIRYSSALYGYNESLPIAVASNAQLQEIAYDGFEDYSFSSGNCNSFAKDHHFDFYKYKQYVFPYFAHT